MEYILFVLYLVFFAWVVTRIRFFSQSGLSDPQIVIIFLLKVMAGIFYGWIGLYYGGLAQMSDTWGFHTNGVSEYNLLRKEPGEYMTNLFRNPYENNFEKFFNADESYWNDLKGNAFIKILSIFNIFSFGYYYVNVVFYSFLSLFGPMAIYRVMDDAFPGKRITLLIGCFLIPSFLYWTGGIHKEGMIFLGISLVIYHVYFALKENSLRIKRIAGILLGLLIILILRNFILVLLCPAVLAWIIATKAKRRGLLIFAAFYLVFITSFFTIRHIFPSLDFPKAVVTKQQEFIKLKGNSSIPIEELEPTATSFLKNIPQAFTISMVRPYPNDVRHILTLAAATELTLLYLMLISLIFFRKKVWGNNNFIYFCLFFSITMLLSIGFSVNNLGAIVRYRSLVIPLLVIPMLVQIDWKALSNFFAPGIRKKNHLN